MRELERSSHRSPKPGAASKVPKASRKPTKSKTRAATSTRSKKASSAHEKLLEYRKKRHFDVTSEPSGLEPSAASPKRAPSSKGADADGTERQPRHQPARLKADEHAGNSFVIQKHAASHLHYDFRLELDGVLLSWSVPKGPSLDPKTRRLAMRTEDHPLDYANFEGIIPKGQYGGGTVVVWDRGTWTLEPEASARGGAVDGREAMRKGNLTFTLHGEKLSGRWHLVRTQGRGGREAWLLFKGRDASASDTRDIVVEAPDSVLTQRSVEEVARDGDRVWNSNRNADGAPPGEVPGHAHDESKTPRKRRAGKEKTSELVAKQAKTGSSKTKAAAPDLHELLRSIPLSFKLTNLDKILYPEQGLTKGALFAYLAVVRDFILPHIAKRPLTLVRCPAGRDKHCFFQKHASEGGPTSIKRIPISEGSGTGSTEEYLMVDDLDGLLGTTQLGALELHVWGCHYPRIEKPDVLVFDLDPDVGLGWDDVVRAAFDLRDELSSMGLESLVKTTGGKGLHVVVPFAPRWDWDIVKAFSKAVATHLEKAEPDRFTTNPLKAKRKGRIFLDYLRNGRGATFIAPYSMRARENATVSTPIAWTELESGVDPKSFTITTVPNRLMVMKKDPWKNYDTIAKQSISAAMLKRLGIRQSAAA